MLLTMEGLMFYFQVVRTEMQTATPGHIMDIVGATIMWLVFLALFMYLFKMEDAFIYQQQSEFL